MCEHVSLRGAGVLGECRSPIFFNDPPFRRVRLLLSGPFTRRGQDHCPGTGKRTKNTAETYCRELYKKGELIPILVLIFKDYAKDFGDWEVWPLCLREGHPR
jgi:hypothetical protein